MVEFIENGHLKFAFIAVLLAVVAYFVHLRPGANKLVNGVKDAIEIICSVTVVVLVSIALMWQLKKLLQKVSDYEDPKHGPHVDTHERDPVLRSDLTVGFPKARFFIPVQADLEWFVHASEEDPAIAEASNLKTYERKLLYKRWYNVDPRHFVVMQRKEALGKGWENTAFSIILALPSRTFAKLKAREMAVVNIADADLQFEGSEKRRIFLYDTLIFVPQFREKHSEFKRWHSLLHFAQFDAPSRRRRITILIEPDNPRLRKSLESTGKYGEHETFISANGHVVHEFTLPQSTKGARVRHFEGYWKLSRSKEWAMPTGTS